MERKNIYDLLNVLLHKDDFSLKLSGFQDDVFVEKNKVFFR